MWVSNSNIYADAFLPQTCDQLQSKRTVFLVRSPDSLRWVYAQMPPRTLTSTTAWLLNVRLSGVSVCCCLWHWSLIHRICTLLCTLFSFLFLFPADWLSLHFPIQILEGKFLTVLVNYHQSYWTKPFTPSYFLVTEQPMDDLGPGAH